MYRPNEIAELTTPLKLQTPTPTTSYGVTTKTWTDADGVVMANFKTFGGSERVDNGILSVEDTAQIVCWFRPDITSGCRFILLDGTENTANKKIYEVLGEPENIDQRNQFMKFKVSRIKGGA